MKSITLLLSLVLSVVCHMQTFAAASGSSNPSPTLRGINRHVYIAYRLDGRAGTGTFDDPFNGSTQAKFDAAIYSALKDTGDSCHVHIGPGTFLTRGTRDFHHFANGKSYIVEGAGIGVTTLRLANGTYTDTPSLDTAIFRHWDFAGQAEYVEICHMTLDCNPTNQPIYAGSNNADLGAIVVCTRQGYLHDLDISGVWSRGYETFPVNMHSTTGNAMQLHHVVERVKVVPKAGYMTALSLINQQGGTNRLSGIIRDCIVIGDGNTTPGIGQNGIGSGGWDGVRVENNRLAKLVSGVVIDNLNYRNVTFQGNTFSNCAWGIAYNGSGTYDGIQILFNHFGYMAGNRALLPATSPTSELILGNRFETDTIGTTNAITLTNLNYLLGLTGNIQAQIDAVGGGGGGGGSGLTNGATVTNIYVYGTGSGSAGSLITFTNSSSATDEKKWGVAGHTSTFSLGPISDAGIHNTPFLQAFRTGTKVSEVNLTATNVVSITAPSVTMSGGLTVAGVPVGVGPRIKAQVVFDSSSGTPTILSSYNVTSITDNDVGDYTINFTTALGSTNYAAQLSGRGGVAVPGRLFIEHHDTPTRTTTALRLYAIDGSSMTPVDVERYSVTIFE